MPHGNLSSILGINDKFSQTIFEYVCQMLGKYRCGQFKTSRFFSDQIAKLQVLKYLQVNGITCFLVFLNVSKKLQCVRIEKV